MKLICAIVHANHRKRAQHSHLHWNRLALPLSFTALYDRLSKIIQTHLVCSNFVVCSLNTKQLLAQHIPFPGYTSLPSLWEHPRGCIETIGKWCRDTTHRQLPVQSAWHCASSVFMLNTVLRAGAVCPQTADNQRWISNGWTPISREIHVVCPCSGQSSSILRVACISFYHLAS